MKDKQGHGEQDSNKHDQARVVSVNLHGLTRQAHVLQKGKPVENGEAKPLCKNVSY